MASAPVLLSDGHVSLDPISPSEHPRWHVSRTGSTQVDGTVTLILSSPTQRAEVRIEVADTPDTADIATLAAAVRLVCTWAFSQQRVPAVFWNGPTDPALRAIVHQAGFRVHPLPQRAALDAPDGPTDALYADLTPTDAPSTMGPLLTAREHQVLAQMAHGRSNAEIAEALGISENTVKNHVHAILDRLQAPSRTAAVVQALSSGLASLPNSAHTT